jgi:hypothetical protein
LLTLCAGTDFKIRGSIRIDVGRKEQLVRVIADRHSVCKFDDGQPIVEDLEGGFLSFSVEEVAHDEDWLAFPLGAEITQGMLRGAGTRELAARTCSCRWHRAKAKVNDGNLYHTQKNDVKVWLECAKESACPR